MKISPNFDLREFVPTQIWKNFDAKAVWFINKDIVQAAELLRAITGKQIIVNDWLFGGNMNYCGYRPPDCTIGAFYSQHKLGNAADLHIAGWTGEQMAKVVLDNQGIFKTFITTIENPKSTPTWLHIDCRYTVNRQEILIINP